MYFLHLILDETHFEMDSLLNKNLNDSKHFRARYTDRAKNQATQFFQL